MFIGHFATGLGISSFVQRNSLTLFVLILGTQVLDVLWGIFIIFGIEGGITGGRVEDNFFDTPWSHSFLMVIIWSMLYAIIVYFIFKNQSDRKNITKFSALSVFSHWILDMIVHQDDMLLTPFAETTIPTLQLWQYPVIALILEFFILFSMWFLLYRSEGENTTMKKQVALLVIYAVILVFAFAGSFTDVNPAAVERSYGPVVIVLISLIASIPSVLYANRES